MKNVRIATERLYRTADGRVVAEGDPDAAFLLAAVGQPIPDGIDVPEQATAGTPATEPAEDATSGSEPVADEAKADAQPENKATPAPANKGRGR
mgnify:CR=1 FL=1